MIQTSLIKLHIYINYKYYDYVCKNLFSFQLSSSMCLLKSRYKVLHKMFELFFQTYEKKNDNYYILILILKR